MKLAQLLLALCFSSSIAHGQIFYVIDQDLGNLPSTGLPVDIPISGDTLGQPDNAQYHFNTSSEAGNWGGEVVFQFTLIKPSAITITLNTQSGTNGGDVDFILCSTRNIAPDPSTGKQVALDDIEFEGLDGALPDSHRFVGLDPGTYYLIAEHFDGFDPGSGDPPITPGSTAFTATLTVDEPVFTDFDIILGAIAGANEPLMFNTFGSTFNTELAIYDPFNNLVATNDDVAGTEQSYIALPDGLAAGFYYVVVAGSDTTFGDGLAISTGGTTGTYVLKHSRGELKALKVVTGSTNPAFDQRRVQLYCFEVVDPPSPVIDVGTIASALQSVTLDSLGSSFDTEIAIYDANGYLLARDDDQFPPDFGAGQDCNTPGVVCQSEIFLPDGLTAGTYYFFLAGWNHRFNDGFDAEDLSDPPEMGPYVFNYPTGQVTGDTSVPAVDGQWFKFTISPAPGSEQITSVDRTPSGEVTLTFESEVGAVYRIESALVLDAWFPVETGVASQGLSTTYAAGIILENQRYFRVQKESAGFGEF